ncbi:MAG: glycosyltransferase family 2 protein [Hymenobacter sp.]|nr:MAG: glycosyltransferase family 2 protein [Hymenobacter sp.]
MNQPLVSIITINYNQAQMTCALLASLRHITYPNLEIIVVDNASPTESPDSIKEQYPEVMLLKSATNLGFAGGNNVGIGQARGEYLLFLNNDTEVESGFLEPLVQVFEQEPRAGIASPKIRYFDGEHLIQYAGSQGLNPWTGRSVTIGHLEADQGQHNVSGPTELADGAAMLVPRRVVEAVGLMPALYFLYYEELDWCEHIKRAGYTCHYVANSTVYHKESASVGKSSVLKTYYMNRNRLLFIRRNYRGWARLTSTLVFVAAAVPKQALRYAGQREWTHVRALARGLRWHLQHASALPS